MRILVTLKPVDYMASHHQYGVLAEIDWDSRQFIRALKLPSAAFKSRHAFMAPLTGGVCVVGDRVFAAMWNFIIEVDYKSFEIVNVFSHPLMADLHGLSSDGDNLWVASTGIDAVLCLDVRSKALKWRWGPDEPILYQDAVLGLEAMLARLARRHSLIRKVWRRLRLESRAFFTGGERRHIHKSMTVYHNHHLNGAIPNGEMLFVTTKGWNGDANRSAVIALDTHTMQADFLVRPGGFSGMHDGVLVGGRLYVTQSGNNSVGWLEPDGNVISRRVEPSPYFVRGMCHTGHSFIVGFTTHRERLDLPALLVEYDESFSEELGRMDVSRFYPPDQGTAVHSIAPAPG